MLRLALLLICMLGGCASPRAVLVNDQGEYLTCAATSAGLIGSVVAQGRYDSCVAAAKENGYRVEYERQ